jgi:hypothetical protein
VVPEERFVRVIVARRTRIVSAHVLIAYFALLGCERHDPSQSDALRPVVRVRPTIENVPLGGRSKDIEVIEAVKIMSDCPIRTQLTDVGRQASERQKIIACLGKLARYRTSVLRAAEVEYTKDLTARGAYSQLDDLGVLFLLNRYIFNVPDASPRSEARFFGGWEGVRVTENEVNLLWPLAVGKSGDLELSSTFDGYNGPVFRAVDEFDYFDRRFGRRAGK